MYGCSLDTVGAEHFKDIVENHQDKKIKELRTDTNGEYYSIVIENYVKNIIQQKKTNFHTPEQNGLAESSNRSILIE